MLPRYISEMAEGSHVDALFVIRTKEARSARTGDMYLALELSDKTGAIPAVYFRPTRLAIDIPVGSVVSVRGVVTSYRGTRRVSVEQLAAADSWDPADFIASCVRPIAESVAEFKALVKSVTMPELRALLRAVFGDARFFARFCECPGAQCYHHAHVGGLLEHTVSVTDHCSRIAARYDGVDRDLLVSAALLHDIGKVEELAFEVGIGYSDTGRLIGHVVLGVQIVHAAGSRSGVSPQLLTRLEHALLSHHGELEWGSPKRPSTLEAMVLHHVDNLDAKVAGFSEALTGAALMDERWTDANNLFRRPLYAPRPAEDERPAPIDEDAQHFRLTA